MKQKQKTTRYYYGPPGKEKANYYTVTVSNAKQPVTINGDVIHALRGMPGSTVGCGLSWMAWNNAKQFPHPVVALPAFTKSSVLIPDRLAKNGSVAHVVRYRHNYKHITDANDRGILKDMVKKDPKIVERPFHTSTAG